MFPLIVTQCTPSRLLAKAGIHRASNRLRDIDMDSCLRRNDAHMLLRVLRIPSVQVLGVDQTKPGKSS